MIPTYDIENLTGGLDAMFQNVMKIGFTIAVILLTVWIVASLLIWLFRSQEKIWKSNKIGIKNFIITLVLIIFILVIPLLLNMF